MLFIHQAIKTWSVNKTGDCQDMRPALRLHKAQGMAMAGGAQLCQYVDLYMHLIQDACVSGIAS